MLFELLICSLKLGPGHFIFSAQSQATPTNLCHGGVTSQAGTSMATPLVAGTAALVRQYYLDGFYPSGVSKADDGFTPMGALVKATLIHSAALLPGQFRNVPLPAAPSIYQGFGLVNTANVLPFNLTSNVRHSAGAALKSQAGDGGAGVGEPFDLYVCGNFADMRSVTTAGEQHTFTIWSTPISSRLVRVGPVIASAYTYADMKTTLVWHDAPASQQSRRQLVNDLDLSVEVSAGVGVVGNGGGGGTSTTAVPILRSTQVAADPISGARPDRVNNMEQVVVRLGERVVYDGGAGATAAAAELGGNTSSALPLDGTDNRTRVHSKIIVAGARIPVGPQPFALVGHCALNVAVS